MRILYCVTGAEFGGAVVHVLGMMRADINKGHIVGLVAAPEPTLISRAEKLNVQIFPNRFFVRRVQLLNDIRALRPVFQAIRRFKPDIVSAHSTKSGYAARLTGAMLKKPVVFTAHGWAFTEGRSRWKRILLAVAERLAARVTTRIICVSNHDLDLAIKFKVAPANKLVLIHNGLQMAAGIDRNKARKKFKLAEVPVITMVGRLAPPKDPLTLLKACRLLKGKFRLLVVGDGELRQQAEDFVKRNGLESQVTFMGERQDVAEILAASDIFVLSSHREGLPLSIIEAELARLPVVASNVGGVPELINDGINGFLAAPKNVQALAEGLQKLLDDADLRRRAGLASLEKALNEFTFDRMLSKTYEVYEAALNSRNKPSEKRAQKKISPLRGN